MTITTTDLTVCVVVKDRVELMTRCLASLAALTPRPGAFVLIDNGSSDGTYELLQRWAEDNPSVTVLQDRGSLGAIRNLAVRTASTSHVAFLDSDCEADPEWIAQHVAAWNASTDERLASVQGCTRPNPAHATPWWSMTQTITSFSGRYEACNISYESAALLATPGFDERIGYLGEDSAAGWHLERAGRTGSFAPDALVLHAVVPVGLKGQVRRAWRYGKMCRLLKLFPEKRTGLINGVFLTKRTRATWLLLLGLATMVASSFIDPDDAVWGHWDISSAAFGIGILLCGVWAKITLPHNGTARSGLKALFGRAVVDITMVVSLVIGSLRHRCLVL